MRGDVREGGGKGTLDTMSTGILVVRWQLACEYHGGKRRLYMIARVVYFHVHFKVCGRIVERGERP